MELLYVLERIRMPVLNEFMLLVTRLGEETAFLAVAMIIFWCVDKRKGYFLLCVGFMGSMINHALKLTFRIPRPWVRDPNFTILEQAREEATGYSFPSGHSQSAVGTFGAVACVTNKKWIRWLCIACCILVPLSRMYIGVHTPADVLAASAYSLGLVWLLRPVATEKGSRYMIYLIPLMLAMALGSHFYFKQLTHLDSLDPHNFESGVKNIYTMFGCITGIGIVYAVDTKYVQFPTEGKWWVQLIKVLVGFGIVLLVKEGFRAPLEMVFSNYIARAIRYFFVVMTAGIFWPMTFSRLQTLGDKK